MSRFVHRRNGAIASAHAERQPGYAEEELADDSPELVAHLQGAQTPDPSNADNLEKALKAVLLAAAAMAGKTPTQARNAFLAAWQALS